MAAPAARCVEGDLDHCPGTQGYTHLRVSSPQPCEKQPLLMHRHFHLRKACVPPVRKRLGKGRSLPHGGTASKTASCHISLTRWINSSEKNTWRPVRKNSLLCPCCSVAMRRARQRGIMADGWLWGHTEPRAATGKPMQASARALQPSLGSCPVSPNCWRNKWVETAANLPVSSA